MSNIEIFVKNGTWEAHQWYLLQLSGSAENLFYSPTLGTAFLLDNEYANTISTDNIPLQITQILKQKLSKPFIPTANRAKAFHLALGLTKNCTLACRYCHADADKQMVCDEKVVNSAIEYAFTQAGKKPAGMLTVSFAVGGEPTLNWRAFRNAVNKIRTCENEKYQGVKKVFLSMTTNCYYGEAKRRFVGENFDSLTLSIDGYPEIHNIHRPTRQMAESFSKVHESCKYFLNSTSCKIGIRATVSDLSVHKLTGIVEYFANTFGNRYTITFEPLIQIGRAIKNSLNTPNEEDFAENFWKAMLRGRELGIKVMSSGINISRLTKQYCGAMSIPSFTVCTDGVLTTCHRDQDGEQYSYGRIDVRTGEVIIDPTKVAKNIDDSKPPLECSNCFANLHCAGDCPDLRKVNYSRCRFNKFIVYKQLEELLRTNKSTQYPQ